MDLGPLVIAVLLGVSHGLEPDHVAGIVGLVGDASPRRGTLVGGTFGAGHATIVAVWLAVATLLLGSRPPVSEVVGDTVLGVVLLAVAGVVAWDARHTLRSESHHAHPGAGLARADGGSDRLLTFGLVGALLTLSPPLTMLGFVTAVLPTAGPASAWLAVAAYTGTIVGTMAAVGAAGATAVRRLGAHDRRYVAAGKATAALTLAALGVTTLV